jgi:D-tyrosyl-tRNA(Tyr) deacylase
MKRHINVTLVSQFTLYGRVNKGTKPDFSKAMKSDSSLELYNYFLEEMRKAHKPEKIHGEYTQADLAVCVLLTES